MQNSLREITCRLNNCVIINGYEELLTEEEAERYKPVKYKNFDIYEMDYIKKIKPNRSENYDRK